MSPSLTVPSEPRQVRSNINFQKSALKKHIEYEVCLSQSRNPDFVVAHPNELKDKNPDWKREIIKRVTNQENTRLKLLAVRLEKRTGKRRISA